MRPLRAFAFVVGATACAGRAAVECAPLPASFPSVPGVAEDGGTRWSFDGAPESQPHGFDFLVTGGSPGRWILRARADAPSAPTVLSQEDGNREASRFALAVASGPAFGDVSVAVRCAPVGGRIDRACGLVWRLADERNYYLARANALENNVRFYYVQNGSRHEVASWDGAVTSCAWHILRAEMRGDHVQVYWDDRKVIDARDNRFVGPGRVGVWTKADSRTLFDDLVARGLR